MVLVFGDDSVTGNIPVFVGGNRVQKVPGVSQSIGSDWSQVGKLKVAVENFTNVAAAWSINSHTESDQVNQDSDKTPENTRKKSKDISGKLKNKQRDRSSSLVEKSTGPSVSVEKTLRKQSKSKDDILTKKNKKNKNKDESGGKKPKKSKKNKVDSEVLKSGKSKSVSKLR